MRYSAVRNACDIVYIHLAVKFGKQFTVTISNKFNVLAFIY